MNTNLPTDSPREDWTLDELGQYAQKIAKRTAHDAWLLGRAYSIAKTKAKAEGLKVEKWRKEWLPFVSQPTLSRYEAVAKLTEVEVAKKGLNEVYRMIGLTPQKANSTKAKDAVNAMTGGSTHRTNDAEAGHTPTDKGSAEVSPKQLPFKVIPAEPVGEPDSVLRRLASVVTLLHSVVADMPSLSITDDPSAAINDAMGLLKQLRAAVKQKETA